MVLSNARISVGGVRSARCAPRCATTGICMFGRPDRRAFATACTASSALYRLGSFYLPRLVDREVRGAVSEKTAALSWRRRCPQLVAIEI